MASDLDPHWERFAAREPYFAVLTSPRFRQQNLTEERRREFFDSGEALAAAMFRAVELQVSPYFNPTSILEFGCGVGRLALPLARRAGRNGGTVTAVDRSPAMLAVARQEAERRGITNVEFCAPDALFSTAHAFDFVSCYLVLQRLPPAEGLPLIAMLIDLLTPKGVGAFHVPFRVTSSTAVAAIRWARRTLPLANAVVNVARARPLNEPFVGAYAYDLAEVFGVLQRHGIRTAHVVFEPHGGLDTALLYVEKPADLSQGEDADDGSAPIDVDAVIARASVRELNEAAEEYFASITNWEHQLTKPFSQAHEAPTLLLDMAVLLQGLRLTAGATVLDFGAGTGWFARYLTQLGCRVVLLDVSKTALAKARELYERQPVIGDRPAPEFVLFDGETIPLPDASVDRVLSFHAFHHTPHPVAILKELARVLKPGGVAGFAEPGPQHSRTPVSQFEMRNYKVVENDIDVHALWRAAKSLGFGQLQLAIFHGPAFHVTLSDFEDFLAGGPATAPWVTSTRVFLRNARTFFLIKEGIERVDSRRAEGLQCHIHAIAAVEPVGPDRPFTVEALVTNTGTAAWLPTDAGTGSVSIGAHLYDAAGNLLTFDAARSAIGDPAEEIAPGETRRVRLTVPAQRPGRYLVELDCVAAQVSWFAPLGSRPARIPVTVGS